MYTEHLKYNNYPTNFGEKKSGASASSEDGFTFAEVMIAISILAIVITALVGLMNMSTAMSVRAENKARLTDAIAQLADRLRAMPFETADKVTTYVSTEGDIVMDLTTAASQVGTASIKTIKIEGYSTRTDPNNTQKATVVLRKLTYENDEEVAFEDPPVLSAFSIVQKGKVAPVVEGNAVWGTVNITVSATAGSAEAVLSALRVYADSDVIGEVLAPNNNGTYTIAWDTTKLNEQSKALYLDGTKRIIFEAIDNLGGLTREERYVRLDNVPVTTTFPSQTIAHTTGSKITVVWGAIPDPDGLASIAARYYVVLRKTPKKGTPVDFTQTINPADVKSDAPTTAIFDTSYDKKSTYEVFVYPMCPDGCEHENVYSTKYLYKKF